jgi:hypothetical protein
LSVLLAAASCGPIASGTYDGGIDVSSDPEQTAISDPTPLRRTLDGYDLTLTPLANYVLRGVVLGRERYSWGWQADLAPCDVAMAWGPLVEDGLYTRLHWSQDNRWYFWHWRGSFPHDNAFIARYSSNTHVIPATNNLRRAVMSLSAGDIAELSGELVRVDGRDGGATVWWVSSTRRDDTGDGSCEVLYLRRLRTDHRIYE